MLELTVIEMDEVGGGGTKIGTTSSGDTQALDGADLMPLGGIRVDPDGANN